MPTSKLAGALLAAALTLSPGASTGQTAAPTPTAVDYADGASWLCRPDRDDACAIGLDATVIEADGSLSIEPFRPDTSPPIDCFYVYPTVSTDSTVNSDMSPDAAERRVVEQQFARFGSVCRTFAPSYRQVTLAGLRASMAGGTRFDLSGGLAYGDVRDAFRHYVENDNDGRGFVLVGHSQGAFLLTSLLRQEIDGQPLQDRLVSAILMGATVPVTRGRDVGGTLESIPLCREAGQTGCLITFASYRATVPPGPDALFGRTEDPALQAGCTNPALLSGADGQLHAYLSSNGSTIVGGRPPRPWVDGGADIGTPFVSVPGLLSARCVANEHATFLEITVHGDPSDPRADDIGGDLTPQWGLHLVDVNLAMGDLLAIVRNQSRAWSATR